MRVSFVSVCRNWGERARRKSLQLAFPDLVTFPCPVCGRGIPNVAVRIDLGHNYRNGLPLGPFHCWACNALLRTSSAYRWYVLVGTTGLAFFIPWALRVGPWYLWLGAFALSWVLLTLLSGAYVKILFPPKILRYDGPPIPRILDNPDELPINPWRKL